jgi:hypothetical protein
LRQVLSCGLSHVVFWNESSGGNLSRLRTRISEIALLAEDYGFGLAAGGQ